MHNLYTWADVPETLRYLAVSSHVPLGLFVLFPCFILKSHALRVHSCFTSSSLCCFPAVFCVTLVSSASESSVYTVLCLILSAARLSLYYQSNSTCLLLCTPPVYNLFIYLPFACCLLVLFTALIDFLCMTTSFQAQTLISEPSPGLLCDLCISVDSQLEEKQHSWFKHIRQPGVCDAEKGFACCRITRSVQTEPPASGLPLPGMWRMTLTAESECAAFNADRHTLCWAWQINRLPAQQAPGKEINITAVSLLNLLEATNSETRVWQETHFQLSHVPV